jgi:hypothetical protein
MTYSNGFSADGGAGVPACVSGFQAARLTAVFLLTMLPLTANDLDAAFGRLYNFDFPGANAAIDRHIAANPSDPLGYGVRSSALLFHELDRLGILEGEFFADDKRIIDKKKLKPDPEIRQKLFQALGDTESRANAILQSSPDDANALFSLTMSAGIVVDYTALVEKRQLASLAYVKKSAAAAQRLVRAHPDYYDAYLSTGLTEYLLGNLPFFVRWFVRIEDIQGNKLGGMQKVEMTARKGRFLRPFAKILLAIANVREGKPTRTREILTELTRDYPENPLLKKELAKVTSRLNSGELKDR